MRRMASFPASRLNKLPGAMPALTARYARHLPVLASVLLVALIGKLAADLVWALVPTSDAPAWRPPAVNGARPAAKSGVNIAAISGAHLFGQYTAPAEPALADIAAAPDTQLNLTLLGILSNERNEQNGLSRALIAAQGGDEKPYAVGDDVARGVQLTAIFPDRVILNRNGKLETLRLNKDAPPPPGLPPSSLTRAAPPAPVASSADAAESLAGIRSQLLADPSKVSDYIRVQPVNSGGGLSGYRIYPGRDRTVFTSAGLRPGDVVTAVNGVSLNDPARSLQLLSELSESSQINLTVDRGGQPQNFSLSFE